MNRSISFEEYLSCLDGRDVATLVMEKSEIPGVISGKILFKIKEKVLSKEYVRDSFRKFSTKTRAELFKIYLCGLCSSEDIDEKSEADLLNSLIVYAQKEKQSVEKRYLTSFPEFITNVAEIFSEEFQANTLINFSTTPALPAHDYIIFISSILKKDLRLKKNGTFPLQFIKSLKENSSFSAIIGYMSESFPKKEECLLHNHEYYLSFLLEFAFWREDLFRTCDNEIITSYSTYQKFLDSDFSTEELKEFFEKKWINGDFLNEIFNSAHEQKTITLPPLADSDYTSKYFFTLAMIKYLNLAEIHIENGFITIGSTPELRVSSTTTPPILVMPDFQTLIQPIASPSLFARFMLCGETTTFDNIYSGAISRESIENSLNRGVDSIVIFDFLTESNASISIVETVKEWVREHSRLSVYTGSLLIIRDENTRKMIESMNEISDLIHKIDGIKSIYTIEENMAENVERFLSKKGFNTNFPRTKIHKKILNANNESYKLDIIKKLPSSTEIKDNENYSPKLGASKYGETLKSVGPNEILQITEYSILMENNLMLEYASEDGKTTMIEIIPTTTNASSEPYILGKLVDNNEQKKFKLSDIKRIAVKE